MRAFALILVLPLAVLAADYEANWACTGPGFLDTGLRLMFRAFFEASGVYQSDEREEWAQEADAPYAPPIVSMSPTKVSLDELLASRAHLRFPWHRVSYHG